MIATASALNLVVRTDSRIYALPLVHVVHVLRPLPIEPLAGAPGSVRGLSVVRGEPVVIVDLALLLGGSEGPRGRLVVVRAGERRAALLVDEVVGIRDLAPVPRCDLPPLLRDASPEVIDKVGALDEQVLLVLKTGSLVPDTVWDSLAPVEG